MTAETASDLRKRVRIDPVNTSGPGAHRWRDELLIRGLNRLIGVDL